MTTRRVAGATVSVVLVLALLAGVSGAVPGATASTANLDAASASDLPTDGPTPTPTSTPTATPGSILSTVTNATGDSVNDTVGTVTNETDGIVNETRDVVNETGDVVNESGETLNETDETADQITNETDDTGDDLTNETGDVVDETGDVVNETGDVVNETGDVVNETGDVVNETGDVIEETNETVDETVEAVTNTTDSATNGTTSTLANVTGESGDSLVDGATNLTGGASGVVGATAGAVNVTAGVSATVSSSGDESSIRVAGNASTTGVPPATTPASTASEPVEPTAGQGNASGLVGADPGRSVGASDGSVPGPGRPSPGGAAVGGALVVTAVGAAAASKHVATSTAAAQGDELVWAGRIVRARASGTADSVKAKLARLPRIVFPFGYSRHDDSDPLEHEVRASLFESVERSPGINLSTLAEGVDVSLSSVRHHLRILEAENLVVGERIRGQRRYFLPNEVNPELVAALDDPATAPILTTLGTQGPTSVSDLADRLGRDPSTISHHVSRLEADGLVERERDGRTVLNDLAPIASRAMSQGPTGRRRPVATE